MGVMPCRKEGCNSIQCRKYNPKFGYICNECFNNLIKYCNYKKSISETTIQEFMDMDKSISFSEELDFTNALNKIFR